MTPRNRCTDRRGVMSSEPGDGAEQHAADAAGEPGDPAAVDLPADDAPDPAEVEALTLELARAQAERDAAVAALDKQGRRDRRRTRVRRGLVGVLVVLFSVLLPITFVVTWAHRVALNTDGFESTVGPLADHPAVTAAVGAAVTNQIFASLNPQQIVANALPPKASFLAGPVTNAAKGYVQQAVTTVLQSDQFQALWQQSTRFAHAELVGVLEGHSNAVTTTNGQVVLNLVPLLNSALQNLQGFVSGVVGRTVTLPTITDNEAPASACQAIANALNRPIPSTCGQIPLFKADKLSEARRAVQAFNRIMVLLLILTPVVAALALWLSRRRRRTLLQLCAGGVIGLVVVRRVVIWLESSLVNSGQAANRAARQAIVAQVLHQYFSVSRWLILGLVIVFAVTLVTGPYAWAHSLRRAVSRYAVRARQVAVATVGHVRDDTTTAWIGSHLDLLRILGVVVAVVVLLVFSISFVGLLIVAALLAAYELWLYQVGRSMAAVGPGPSEPGPRDSETPDAGPRAAGETGPARAT